nr:hypothetical protein [Streptomyces sp. PSKA30]
MSGNFNECPANDGVASDRWASALHLFGNGAGLPHEETTVERWERAQLLFDAKDYIDAVRLLAAAFSGEFPDGD